VPADLIDAVIAQLEQDVAVTTAFGDTWNQVLQTGTAKFFADLADQVPAPYAVLQELDESYDYMTRVAGGVVNYTAPGQMQVDIWAPDRLQARQLGFVVAKSLNDAPLAWPDQTLMEFRLIRSMFIPSPAGSGPGVPIMFHRMFLFEYVYSGAI
jgi:hypothetical protein